MSDYDYTLSRECSWHFYFDEVLVTDLIHFNYITNIVQRTVHTLHFIASIASKPRMIAPQFEISLIKRHRKLHIHSIKSSISHVPCKYSSYVCRWACCLKVSYFRESARHFQAYNAYIKYDFVIIIKYSFFVGKKRSPKWAKLFPFHNFIYKYSTSYLHLKCFKYSHFS